MPRLLIAAGSLLSGALILFVLDRSGKLLFQAIGLLGTAFFAFSVILMLLTFRKARRLSLWVLAGSALISIVCTLLFYALAPAPLSTAMALTATTVGLGAGMVWSLSNLLFVDRENIQIRGTLWSLVVWAVSIAIPQLLGIFGYRSPVSAALFSFFGMGLAVGNTLGLSKRCSCARRIAIIRTEAQA